VSERNWWVGLDCALCGQPVKITDADAVFHRGLANDEPTAEHYECRSFHNAVADRLREIRESK
jgi:hypothetical protein